MRCCSVYFFTPPKRLETSACSAGRPIQAQFGREFARRPGADCAAIANPQQVNQLGDACPVGILPDRKSVAAQAPRRNPYAMNLPRIAVQRMMSSSKPLRCESNTSLPVSMARRRVAGGGDEARGQAPDAQPGRRAWISIVDGLPAAPVLAAKLGVPRRLPIPFECQRSAFPVRWRPATLAQVMR